MILYIVLALGLVYAKHSKGAKQHNSTNVTLAFGACFKFYRNHETDIFARILQENPSYFLWLGDAAYIDYMPILGFWFPETDPIKVEEKFNITKNDKYYQIFKKKVQIKGTYDDHDINQNNGGKYNPHKAMTRDKYLDFIDEPKNSTLRTQAGGIYQSFKIHENILVIMTDVRYESDSNIGDNLGELQWAWLEQQFKQNVSLYILTSGVQVLPDDRQGPETWFPQSKNRLFYLIKQYGVNIIFLSGDVHYSELLTHPCANRIGTQLHEFTSSGLTFANQDHIPFVDTIFKFIFPPTYSNLAKDHYYSKNYGIVRIQINQATNLPETIYLESHSSEDSSIKLSRVIKIKDLKVQQNDSSSCVLDESAANIYWNNVKQQIKEHQVIVAALLISTLLVIVISLYLSYMWIAKVKVIYYQQL